MSRFVDRQVAARVASTVARGGGTSDCRSAAPAGAALAHRPARRRLVPDRLRDEGADPRGAARGTVRAVQAPQSDDGDGTRAAGDRGVVADLRGAAPGDAGGDCRGGGVRAVFARHDGAAASRRGGCLRRARAQPPSGSGTDGDPQRGQLGAGGAIPGRSIRSGGDAAGLLLPNAGARGGSRRHSGGGDGQIYVVQRLARRGAIPVLAQAEFGRPTTSSHGPAASSIRIPPSAAVAILPSWGAGSRVPRRGSKRARPSRNSWGSARPSRRWSCFATCC